MRLRTALAPVIAAVLVGGCGYIVTPEDESSPTAAAGQGWAAIATKVETADGGLHVDLSIRNDTGSWSAMQAAAGKPAILTGGDGKTTDCASVFVGTGGTSIAPGFQVRGYTGGTKATPKTQPLYVECAGAAPAAGMRLAIPVSFVTGDFNYFSPSATTTATVTVELDKVATDLVYPVATPIDGVIDTSDAKIIAINKCTLSLVTAKRTADGLEFDWKTENPTAYPSYVHIGTPPVVGSDGVIYGFYESPHLADTPITPAKESATWTTKVAVPPDDTGLYILVSVESKQQKNFVSHAIDITDK